MITSNSNGITSKRKPNGREIEDKMAADMAERTGANPIYNAEEISPDDVEEVNSAPLHLLPPVFEKMARALAYAFNIPEDRHGMIFALVDGMIAGALGPMLETEDGENVTSPEAFILVGAPTGAGKGQICKKLFAPIVEHIRQLRKEHASKVRPRALAEKCMIETKVGKIKSSKRKLPKVNCSPCKISWPRPMKGWPFWN